MHADGRQGNRRKRGPLSAYAVRIRERLARGQKKLAAETRADPGVFRLVSPRQ